MSRKDMVEPKIARMCATKYTHTLLRELCISDELSNNGGIDVRQ